jgi:DNA repair protein RecO (recombination protein O)
MAPPKTYRCEAIILKRIPLGEADLLVTFYSREFGKVRAVAKGARRSTSRLVGHLEPLTLLRLSLAQTRTLDIITQVQIMRNFTHLKGDLDAISRGLYVAELVDGFGSEANPNFELYYLAIETLEAIGWFPNSDLPLRYFDLHLMEVSGLMPDLYNCVECRKQLVAGQHRFSSDLGGTLCLDCTPVDALIRPLSLRALKVLRMLGRKGLVESMSLHIEGALLQEVQAVLCTTVLYWLNKEIRSNSFLEDLRCSEASRVYS